MAIVGGSQLSLHPDQSVNMAGLGSVPIFILLLSFASIYPLLLSCGLLHFLRLSWSMEGCIQATFVAHFRVLVLSSSSCFLLLVLALQPYSNVSTTWVPFRFICIFYCLSDSLSSVSFLYL